jgi:hypothetical protein
MTDIIEVQHELTHTAKMHLNILLSKESVLNQQEMLIVLILLSNVLSAKDLNLWVLNCIRCIYVKEVYRQEQHMPVCYAGFDWSSSSQGHAYWASALTISSE